MFDPGRLTIKDTCCSLRCWLAALPMAILLLGSTFHPSIALAAPQGYHPPAVYHPPPRTYHPVQYYPLPYLPPAINNPNPGPPIGLIAVVIIVVALPVFLIVVFSSRGGSTDFLTAPSLIYGKITQKTNTETSPQTDRSARFEDYHDLRNAAESRGFHVTHDIDGVHNANSLHYKGRAIDVRTWDHTSQQVDAFITQMRDLGLTVFDERTRPPQQAQWDGAHVHVQIPQRTRSPRQDSTLTTRYRSLRNNSL
jgi:hypothetical protein